VIRISMAFAGLALAAGAALAQVESGLPVGATVGAFQVVDVAGPTPGKQHCHI